jgi:hypothetical protein
MHHILMLFASSGCSAATPERRIPPCAKDHASHEENGQVDAGRRRKIAAVKKTVHLMVVAD